MLILIYLAIGLALAYNFGTAKGAVLTHEPLLTLIVVLFWPYVPLAILQESCVIKNWRGRKIWNPVK